MYSGSNNHTSGLSTTAAGTTPPTSGAVRKRLRSEQSTRGAYGRGTNFKRAGAQATRQVVKVEATNDMASPGAGTKINNDMDTIKKADAINATLDDPIGLTSVVSSNNEHDERLNRNDPMSGSSGTDANGTDEDPLVRQFCIRMKSTLTKRGCQHFKSSGYRVVHVVAHLRSYQSNDNGHLMDPLDDPALSNHTNAKCATAAHSNNNNNTCTDQSSSETTATVNGSTTNGSKYVAKKRAKLNNNNINNNIKGEPNESVEQTKQQADFLGASSADTKSNKSSNRDQRYTVNNKRLDEQKSPVRRKIIGMVALAIALPPPSINELRLESDTFVMRLSLDLRVTHIEPKITELLQYPIELIAGRSLYTLIHPADVHQVQKCHRDLLRKGQMMSGYYRLLARSGGYIWIQTCATLICNNTTTPATPTPTATSTPGLAGPAIGSHHAHSGGLLLESTSPNNNNSSRPPSNNSQQPYLGLAIMDTTTSKQFANPNDSTMAGDNKQQQASSSTASYVEHAQYIAPFKQPAATLTSPSGLLQSQAHYDLGQTQDQCVIFVNYMVTNIIERDEIIDICQMSQYFPLTSTAATAAMIPSNTNATQISGTDTSANNSNNNNNITNNMNVYTSLCPSPCLSGSNNQKNSSKTTPTTVTASTPLQCYLPVPSNNNDCTANVSPMSTSTNVSDVSSQQQQNRRHHHHHHHHNRDPKTGNRSSNKAPNEASTKPSYSHKRHNGTVKSSSKHLSSYQQSETNGSSTENIDSKHDSRFEDDNYAQTGASSGVNLVVSKSISSDSNNEQQTATVTPGWLTAAATANYQHQEHETVLSNDIGQQQPVNNQQQQQYTNIDRYKATAFGLESHHSQSHQQQPHQHQQRQYSSGNSNQHPVAMYNSTAAVAAAAAASANPAVYAAAAINYPTAQAAAAWNTTAAATGHHLSTAGHHHYAAHYAQHPHHAGSYHHHQQHTTHAATGHSQPTGAATNPYAQHLDAAAHHQHHQVTAAQHHHQSSLASSAAAAAAAANHHHPAAAASSYYNYYGYYGNKFI